MDPRDLMHLYTAAPHAYSFLISRTGAFGDVLEVTAVTRRLRQENPEAVIDVATQYPAVFLGNRDVNRAAFGPVMGRHYDRLIRLDGAFEERLRKVHPIDAYSEVIFGDRATPHEIVFAAKPISAELSRLLGSRLVVIHPCRNWPIRTLALEWWQELVDRLTAKEFVVAVTGTRQDHDGLSGAIDLREKLSMAEQAGLIAAAKCFVCSESGPMILAQTTQTPVIAMLTMTPAYRVMHVRNGVEGWGFHAVPAPVPCQGCEAAHDAPATYFECLHARGSPEFQRCVTSFDAVAVAALVERQCVETVQ
jgi:ADP-heptose:LPS heptosyltransferase